MKPSKLPDYSEPCPVVGLDELPFQEGRPLIPLEEEEDSTTLLTSRTRNYSPEREVFMVGIVGGQQIDENGAGDAKLDDSCTKK
jgi:hypothetical protein